MLETALRKKRLLGVLVLVPILGLACAMNGRNRGRESLLHAVTRGDYAAVQRLIAKGVDVNRADKDGVTPLMWAATYGHTDIAKALIAKGADVNARTPQGDTALIFAVTSRYLPMVKLLIDHGADVNAADKTGRTALMMAGRQADIVDLLKKSGAEMHVPGTLNLFGKDDDD